MLNVVAAPVEALAKAGGCDGILTNEMEFGLK
jgi:hypothetical protein